MPDAELLDGNTREINTIMGPGAILKDAQEEAECIFRHGQIQRLPYTTFSSTSVEYFTCRRCFIIPTGPVAPINSARLLPNNPSMSRRT